MCILLDMQFHTLSHFELYVPHSFTLGVDKYPPYLKQTHAAFPKTVIIAKRIHMYVIRTLELPQFLDIKQFLQTLSVT